MFNLKTLLAAAAILILPTVALAQSNPCASTEKMKEHFGDTDKFLKFSTADAYHDDSSTVVETYLEIEDATYYIVAHYNKDTPPMLPHPMSCILFVGKNLIVHDPKKQESKGIFKQSF
jgi:hypothetical protein